ncbi:hypothetical protein J6590_059994 [Homalodisca vitripennis]|nr:hypothetical protein J6590_059994 [Homalodisca vitripennis]
MVLVCRHAGVMPSQVLRHPLTLYYGLAFVAFGVLLSPFKVYTRGAQPFLPKGHILKPLWPGGPTSQGIWNPKQYVLLGVLLVELNINPDFWMFAPILREQ